jgi:hexosaminidase
MSVYPKLSLAFLSLLFMSESVTDGGGVMAGMPPLWPKPYDISYGNVDTIVSTGSFQFITIPASPSTTCPQTIWNATISRFTSTIRGNSVAFAPYVRPLNATRLNLQAPTGSSTSSPTISSITIHVPSLCDTMPTLDTDESYSLNISTSNATITASSIFGAMHGLTSFVQLLNNINGTTYINQLPIAVKDAPAYKWRGVLLDTGRNFLSVPTMKLQLDGMALNKLNVFHWHATDSQSWPLVSSKYPELTQYGAYPSQVYTAADVQDIIQYAATLGIRVVLEIDSPNHIAAIAPSHPDYVTCYNQLPWETVANEPPR